MKTKQDQENLCLKQEINAQIFTLWVKDFKSLDSEIKQEKKLNMKDKRMSAPLNLKSKEVTQRQEEALNLKKSSTKP